MSVDFYFRHIWLILASCIAGLIVAILYIATAQATYTATSTLLIDDSKVDLFQRPSVVSDPVTDSAFIESQIEVLRSDIVAREVVRRLDLVNKPPKPPRGVSAWLKAHGIDFGGMKKAIKDAVGLGDPIETPEMAGMALDPEGVAAAEVSDTLTVKRVGSTYVVTISATTTSPAESFELANTAPEAFIAVDQMSKQASTKHAVAWLDDRLRELRTKSADADQAVENFKRNSSTSGDRGLGSQLRQLESTALSYRNLVDNLQTRYLQAVQEESFISTKARIISPASLPREKSSPKTTLSILAGLLAGFLGGSCIALAREALTQGIRSASELENASGVECLAVLEDLDTGRSIRERLTSRRVASRGASRYAWIVLEKLTLHFSQEMRRLSIALRQRRTQPDKATIVGVVSLFPEEGKTTVTSNLAQALGASGCSTLLIDLDVRNPSLSRAYGPPRDAPEIFDSPELLKSVWRDPLGHVDFMSASRSADLVRHSKLLETKKLLNNFEFLRQHYEFIIIDLPPIKAVADADALKHVVDAFILVTRAGWASSEQVNETLNRFDPQRSHLIGAVLNRADLKNRGGYYDDYR